jgi:hypothetical protein
MVTSKKLLMFGPLPIRIIAGTTFLAHRLLNILVGLSMKLLKENTILLIATTVC